MKLFKPFYKVQTDSKDKELQQSIQLAFDSVENELDSVNRSEIISGNLLENISLSTSVFRLAHKLDRKPRGYMIIRKNAAVTVYDQPTNDESLFLNLLATGDVKVSLWIF